LSIWPNVALGLNITFLANSNFLSKITEVGLYEKRARSVVNFAPALTVTHYHKLL
jgi:hypothetical protein